MDGLTIYRQTDRQSDRDLLVSPCFEPSQPHRVISGLRETEGERKKPQERRKSNSSNSNKNDDIKTKTTTTIKNNKNNTHKPDCMYHRVPMISLE